MTPQDAADVITATAPLGFYPAVATIEDDLLWLVCANGHRWIPATPQSRAGCHTCTDFHRHRLAGRPECAREGCHIVVTASQRAFDHGGVRLCRTHFEEERAAEHHSGIATIDGEIYVFATWSGLRWNGWIMPRMTRDQVELVIDWMQVEPNEQTYTYTWEGDTLVETIRDGDEVYVDRMEPDADGRYGLGAGSWVWQEQELTSDMDTWLRQNDVAAATMTAEQVVLAADYAEHHAGGLYVLLAGTEDGNFVKCHDSWGGPGVVVHTYDADDADSAVDTVEEFDTGREAVARFLTIAQEN